MTESLPISCVSCRRKKIKCNKRKPCNQCQKRHIYCEFPATFRNIVINEDEIDTDEPRSSTTSNPTPSSLSRELLTDLVKLNEEIELLRSEKLSILQENFRLNRKNQQLLTKIAKYDRLEKTESLHEHFPISGETSEMGKKYYGPQSLNFMIETLKKKSLDDTGLKKGGDLPGLQELAPSQSDTDKSHDEDSSNELLEKSLLKKRLPNLLKANPDVSADSETSMGQAKHNMAVIRKLVEMFFLNNVYYKSFIFRESVFNFLETYDSIQDKAWENDDDLLLLYMILLLSVQRLTPKEFFELELLPNKDDEDIIKKCNKHKNYLLNEVLYQNFEKLRHNLINESIITIQAYILCTECYFIEQRYEESWLMLFHSCSIAYAIGLHVMGKFRNDDDNDKEDTTGSNLEEENNDIARFKVWFALKNISGQICSVLGRPNPISIQVNSIVLKSLSELDAGKVDLNATKTQVLFKIGLSECLRLSNMMLIENFMINFTMNDLLELNKKFEKELRLLEYFLSHEYDELGHLDDDQLSYDEESHLPLRVDRTSVIVDLITLYINRAKLFEPFINQFEPQDSTVIVQSLIDSVVKFLDYTIEFISIFLNRVSEKYIDEDRRFMQDIRFGKVFRLYYPFLNSFIYQGIIVIFTFLNYNSKDLVRQRNLETDYDLFLQQMENKINSLLQFDRRVSQILNLRVRLWSSNIVYLMNKNLQQINLIYERRKAEKRKFEQDINELKSQIDPSVDQQMQVDTLENEPGLQNFLGFNMRDPFWLTNPDNLPHYLSSPSDDMNSNSNSGASINKKIKREPEAQSIPNQSLFGMVDMYDNQQMSLGMPAMQSDQLPNQINQQMPYNPYDQQVYGYTNMANYQQPKREEPSSNELYLTDLSHELFHNYPRS